MLVTNCIDMASSSSLSFETVLTRLADTSQRVVYVPVRHHSPVCASMVKRLVELIQPAAVLIEGPSDYNEHLDELMLEHELPIAIYSYFHTDGGKGSGAYYPFCAYSPEWVAIQTARNRNCPVEFIDLPWIETAGLDRTTHRYADAELREGQHVDLLCKRMQVESFDELWDRLVESDWQIEPREFLRRVHALCLHIRFGDGEVSLSDSNRESFMRSRIDAALESHQGPIMVVTGGFHSCGLAFPTNPTHSSFDTVSSTDTESSIKIRGIALTSYSYERLDSLTGYNSGMPSPGFYEWAWTCRSKPAPFSHHPLLVQLVEQLRKRNITLSTADLIAIETSANALAAIRGRPHVWRTDLIDAVTSALVKDEIQFDCRSPFLDAVHAVLRGNRIGKLGDGTRLPALVMDIRNEMENLTIEMPRAASQLRLELQEPSGVARSRLLHRLRLLCIGGVGLIGGTDFIGRRDISEPCEVWELVRSPDFDSTCIEASRYGTTLADAASARLVEVAHHSEFNAAEAAKLLVEACQAGIDTLTGDLLLRMEAMIAEESEFITATEALAHLHYLYYYDETLGTKRSISIAKPLADCFTRSLWLLDALGQKLTDDRKTIAGIRAIQEVMQRSFDCLIEDREDIQRTLYRVLADAQKHASVRGSVAGMLWNLGDADSESILAELFAFHDPNALGDFLAGLYALAREMVQRHPQVVRTIDQALMDFTADRFQLALPAMRLAFTYFTPREKHHMLTTLFQSLGIAPAQSLPELTVAPETAAQAMAIEAKIFEAMARYGLEVQHG